MDNKKIPCEIYADLIPSYLDGVLSDSVNEALENHLKECVSCRDKLGALKKQQRVSDIEDEKKEKAFISKVKGAKHYLIGVIIGFLIPFLLLGAYIVYRVILVNSYF